jgi:hypothetical protein
MTHRPLLLAALTLTACGEAPVAWELDSARLEQGIIGGVASQPGEYPAVGVLLVHGEDPYFGEFGSMACTATLVAPDAILLAAHCVDTSVYYGMDVDFYFSFSENVQSFGAPGRPLTFPADTYTVIDSVKHPDFTMSAFETTEPISGPGLYYDVAVAFLDEPVTDRSPAMVMGPNDSDAIVVNTPVEIVGYGMRTAEYDPYNPDPEDSGIKYHADTFINEVGATEMQIGDVDPAPQKCHGDSGGPTFLDYNDGMTPVQRLVGITSHAYDESDCLRGGVDTRVDAYRDWIEDELVDACVSSVRTSCENGGVLAVPFQPAPPPPAETTPSGYAPTGKFEQADDCSQVRPEPFAALLVLLPLLRRRR